MKDDGDDDDWSSPLPAVDMAQPRDTWGEFIILHMVNGRRLGQDIPHLFMYHGLWICHFRGMWAGGKSFNDAYIRLSQFILLPKKVCK